MIGLTTRTYGWPSTLKKLGFKVESIEPKFLNSEGKEVNPDILFTSNKLLHALITECKGGKSLDRYAKEQIKEYTKITSDSVRHKVGVYDPKRLRIDICFAINESNRGIIKEINEINTFPVIIFSDSKISKENHFNHKKLEDEFSSDIPIHSKPPTYFYPFSDQDDASIIAIHIFQELMRLALANKYKPELDIEIDDLLENIHPLWKNIAERKKKEIRNKTNSIILEYKRKQLGDYLKKIKGKPAWNITKSLQAFGNECNKIIEELSKSVQTTL